MTDYTAKTDVHLGAEQLFDYLSDIANLPKYFSRMTSAEPAEGEAVHVTAKVDDREVEGEAWFRVDTEAQSLAWGSEGPNDYHGTLDVTGDATSSSVTVTLTSNRGGGSEIQDGLEETLANVKRLVEG